VVKDATGRLVFLDLARRRSDASYVAFDLLWLDGRDLRRLPLIERECAPRLLVPRPSRLIEEVLCVPGRGRDLFDLVNIVAKRKDGAYASSEWIKIKTPSYSQAEGRGSCSIHPRRRRDSLRSACLVPDGSAANWSHQ
jgi:ATP-dependent DNA ligase